MSSRLPEYVDPWRAADLGKQFSGRAVLADMQRLSEAVLGIEGEVEFSLHFDRDERKRACVRGSVRATMTLECQRCLGPLRFPVESEMQLALVESPAEAERLPEEYDPLMIEEPRVRLLDIVEDELLLSLPLVPKHESEACAASPKEKRVADTEQATEKEVNPFAVLAEWKSKQT